MECLELFINNIQYIYLKKPASIMSNRSLFFLLICLTFSALAVDYVDPIPVHTLQQPTVVEANHYYSVKQKSVNYNIVSLNNNLPVFIIPKNQHAQRKQYNNKINLTLNDNKGHYISCTLQDNYELCVLQKFNTQSLSMIIQCESLPCQFSWIVLQSSIEQIDTASVQKTSMKQLYEIKQSQQNKHLTIKVTCDSPQFEKGFHQNIQFYANKENYHKLTTDGITYYLFRNPPTSFKQYFYLRVDPKYRQCASIQIFNAQENIKLGTVITDFALGGSDVFFNFQNPHKNMRIDANLHQFTKTGQLQGVFNVKVMGNVGGIMRTISQMSVPTRKKRYVEFSFTIVQIPSQYTNLQLHFESTKIDSIFDFQMVASDVQQVEKGEFSFFSLKKGQKIKYQLIEEKDAQKKDQTYIFSSDEKKVKLSKNQCQTRSGCQFELEAIQDFDGSIYLGQGKTQNVQQTIFVDIKQTFTKRVREDSIIYLKKNLQAKKNYQVVVNTHNVILYAASKQKCQKPGPKCHEKIGNSHHPFIYEGGGKTELLISVHALDETQFTINIIEQDGQYPLLKDGVPFIYLMDDAEEEVIFRFTLEEKEDLTFTLISPINQLLLYTFNGNKLPAKYAQKLDTYTVDGYVFYPKTHINSKDFIVVVRKLDPSKKQYIHFTLIASTKNANIKLQSGVTHHQKLTKSQHQDFIIEYDPAKKYVMSFYLHNFVQPKVDLSLVLSKDDSYVEDSDSSFIVDRTVDQIDISEEGGKLCKTQKTEFCQLFLRVKNNMDIDIDLQITLLSTNSIVELHDGVWSYFPEQLTSTTTSFYFYPKHYNNPISILYDTNNPDLRVFYSLARIDDSNINPQEWPFPNLQNPANKHQLQNLVLKQVKHFHINKQALKKCQPDCLLLISLLKSSLVKGEFDQLDRHKQFGLMVSNNIIDIPQKAKVDVSIQKGQQKYMKMNMKSVLQRQSMTSYIYTTLGSVSVYANTCSEKNFRMPSADDYDFSFGILETQLKTTTIEKKFQQNDIDEQENPYLCILVVGDQNSKFSIEYTSEEDIVGLLRLDEFKTVEVQKGKPKYFQVEGSVEHSIKLIRTKGFPFVQLKKCTGKDETYDDCLADLEQDQGNSQNKFQLIDKVKKYEYTPCQKCIIYLKISSMEPAELDIHLESKYEEITLQEKKVVSDSVEKGGQNKYEITALTNEPTIININVLEGRIKCEVSDMSKIKLQKSSSDKDKAIQFIITPNQYKQARSNQLNSNNDGLSALLSGFGLENIFTTLHVTVKSLDADKQAAYTITYSSGQKQAYLQDGLVNKYNLEANSADKVAKFYYENEDENSHVFLFLGTKKSSELSKLNVHIYSMDELDDEDGKTQIDSKIPELRKKTTRPTVLYPLPTEKFYSVQVSNPTGADIQLSIGINHQQVIFLPYDMQYPFPLTNKQNLNLVVDVQNKGYILLTLKKCDQSNPQISYTFDYDGFKNGQYQYSTTLNNEPKFQYLIKAKEPKSLYINVKRDEQEGYSSDVQFKNSVFAISARYSQIKMKTSDYIKPGNKGLTNYQILSSDKIKVQFTQVTCQAKSQFCNSNFEYFLVASDKMTDVYSQTVCPSTYFADIENNEKHRILPLRRITEKPNNQHKITFEYQFEKANPISYIAIKAVYKNNEGQTVEVYYQPIEVATFWGQLQKASNRHGMKLAALAVIGFCFFLICLRRQKRKGYQSLAESD